MPSPKVSVCVITYKHAPYITQCLQSITSQRCDFPFEVIVRDDASPDQTFDIAERFIKENNIENVSLHRAPKNEGMVPNFLSAIRLCQGDLIAFCEGDDYWTDPQKLQKQVSFMRNHPDCSISTHPCTLDHGKPHKKHITSPAHITSTKPFTMQDVLNVNGQFAPSSSYMMTRQALAALPPWFQEKAPVGDFFVEMYALSVGSGLWMPDIMSAYRIFSTGSWADQLRADGSRLVRLGQRMLDCISLMESEPPFAHISFASKKSALFAAMAYGHLISKNYKTFKSNIEASFTLQPLASPTQNIMHRLRHVPRIASLIYKGKRLIYQLLKVK